MFGDGTYQHSNYERGQDRGSSPQESDSTSGWVPFAGLFSINLVANMSEGSAFIPSLPTTCLFLSTLYTFGFRPEI